MTYRYREASGTTTNAIRAIRHLPKLGRIVKVQGYQYNARYKGENGWYWRVNHRIKVVGELGVAVFNGFCYGYFGEGPKGLIQLFDAIGIPTIGNQSIGFVAAHTIPRSDVEIHHGHRVVDWTLYRGVDTKQHWKGESKGVTL